ncbi:hypothetical protein OG792_09245 [Micromonospora sp. NBC_01699]|uniref:hypothetical protein n=1 Tax=Micromonospora sp. NBC_01699 TaxID=2975984 RepID=UPI002E36723D|nr:hypothetical protein [Micromonospora sp. NBC_01699]
MTMRPPAPLRSRPVQYAILCGYVVLLAAWVVGSLRLRDTGYGQSVYLGGILVMIIVQSLWAWVNGREHSGSRRRTVFAPPRTDGPPVLVAPARAWWRTDRSWRLFAGVALIQYSIFTLGQDLSELDWLLWASGLVVLLAGVAVVGTIVRILLDIHRGADLELRPGGVSLPGLTGRLEVPWAELPSGRLRGRGHTDRLVLRVRRPTSSGLFRRRRPVTVWFDRYAVAPELLTGAIRHYLDHPEHRAAIGTDEEYVRLHVLLHREPDPVG